MIGVKPSPVEVDETELLLAEISMWQQRADKTLANLNSGAVNLFNGTVSVECLKVRDKLLELRSKAKNHGLELDQRMKALEETYNKAVTVLKSEHSFLEQAVPAKYMTDRQLVQNIESTRPDLLAQFYPRIYQDMGQYFSPKMIACALATQVNGVQRATTPLTPNSKALVLGLQELVNKRVPTFFLSSNLLLAVGHTDFKDPIDWIKLKLPFESGLIVLPTDGLEHPTDGPVACIMWHRTQKGMYSVPLLSAGKSYPMQVDFAVIGLAAYCPQTGVWYEAVISQVQNPLVLKDAYQRFTSDQVPLIDHLGNKLDEVQENNPSHVPFLETATSLMFGILMAMQVQPELLERAQLQKVVPASSNKPRKEFWSPNVLGRKYRFEREAPVGTHASPRMHWRRGHYRNQAYGIARSEHKTIWIQPRLINAPKN